MERHSTAIGDHGKSRSGRGRHRRAIRRGIGIHQSVPQFFAGKNYGAHFAEVFIAAGVIAVHVRVDHEANRVRGYLLDRRDDLAGQRSKLSVNEENSVGAGEHADRSALPFERVEIVGDLRGFDFNFAEIRRSLRVRQGCYANRCCKYDKQNLQCCVFHFVSSCVRLEYCLWLSEPWGVYTNPSGVWQSGGMIGRTCQLELIGVTIYGKFATIAKK